MADKNIDELDPRTGEYSIVMDKLDQYSNADGYCTWVFDGLDGPDGKAYAVRVVECTKGDKDSERGRAYVAERLLGGPCFPLSERKQKIKDYVMKRSRFRCEIMEVRRDIEETLDRIDLGGDVNNARKRLASEMIELQRAYAELILNPVGSVIERAHIFESQYLPDSKETSNEEA